MEDERRMGRMGRPVKSGEEKRKCVWAVWDPPLHPFNPQPTPFARVRNVAWFMVDCGDVNDGGGLCVKGADCSGRSNGVKG